MSNYNSASDADTNVVVPPIVPSNPQQSGPSTPSIGSNSTNASQAEPTTSVQKVLLKHNAYLYDDQGKKANQLTLKFDSLLTVYGKEIINDRAFYLVTSPLNNGEKYYIAAGNVDAAKLKLKHDAFVYDKHGRHIQNTKLIRRGRLVDTYGAPVQIRGQKYYIIARSRFVKAANFASLALKATSYNPATSKENSISAVTQKVMHNAYLYNKQGNRANEAIVAAGSIIESPGKTMLNNRTYYELAEGLYIDANNIDGQVMQLGHNAYLYNKYSHRLDKSVLKKNSMIRTYGDAISIKKSKYYIAGKNRYVKKANLLG